MELFFADDFAFDVHRIPTSSRLPTNASLFGPIVIGCSI